jgi:hypothetical protein
MDIFIWYKRTLPKWVFDRDWNAGVKSSSKDGTTKVNDSQCHVDASCINKYVIIYIYTYNNCLIDWWYEPIIVTQQNKWWLTVTMNGASYLICIEGQITISGTTSSILTISCIVIVRITMSNAKQPRTNIIGSNNVFIINMIPC